MNLEKIIAEIFKEFTGDPKKDVDIMFKVMQENGISENSPEFEQIVEGVLNTMMKKDSNGKTIDEMRDSLLEDIDRVISDIITFKQEGQIDEAYAIAEFLVESIEKEGLDTASLEAEEKLFYEPIEHAIYSNLHREIKDYHTPKLPFDQAYFLYGNLLIDQREYEKAIEALKKALEWAPMNEAIRLELAEAYKLTKDFDKAIEEINFVLHNGYTPLHLGHAYRALSYIFSELELYQEALIALELSKRFDPNINKIKDELEYILVKNKGLPELPEPEEAERLLAEYGSPFIAAQTPVDIALQLAYLHENDKHYNGALYYYTIYNNIAHTDLGEQKIMELREKLNLN